MFYFMRLLTVTNLLPLTVMTWISFIDFILFISYVLTLYSQSDKMYNSIILIVQFHCPTCFEPLVWVHLQGIVTHYSHQLVQLFTWILYICVCTLSKTIKKWKCTLLFAISFLCNTVLHVSNLIPVHLQGLQYFKLHWLFYINGTIIHWLIW
jgi:hypothetical protein